jgi:predicted Zn finger-like uncharacterized protein
MQFSCESCKATLHIGDDKVKGKRLVVRCKRCGNRIQIADPALGPAPAAAAPLATSAVLSPVSKPAPKPAPAPAPRQEELRPVADDEPRDSDTEDTRAMESDLLEKALQASKRDDLSSAGMAPIAAQPAPRSAPPPPRDPPVWFAMVAGQQTGPMSRAELGLKAATSAVTGRTYVWKEGMNGWLRAAEVPDLAALFAAPPPPKPAPKPAPAPPKPTPPAQKTAPKQAPAAAPRAGVAEFSTQDFGSLDLGGAAESDDKALSLELDGPVHRTGVSGAPEPISAKTTVPGRPNAKSAPVLAAAPAPEPRPAPDPAAMSGISLDGLSPVNKTAEDDEERTNVESLPLGERVHQEKVASELFNSGEVTGGSSAVDLAKWASSELGKKPPLSGENKKPGPPLMTPQPQAPVQPAAAAAAPAPRADPFADVPDAPGLTLPDKADTTGKVLARSGVTKSRAPMVMGVVFACLVVVAVLGWALVGGEPKPEAPPVPQEVARPSVGGTGDTQVGQQLVAKDPAQKPAAPAKKVAAAGSDAKPAEKAQDQKAAAITQEQADALKQLDNERGVGNHGPKADAAPAVPATSTTEAALTPADIRKKLVENKGALQSCIEDALKKDPALKVGKVRIKTTIAPSGTVTAAAIDKQKVDESPLGACLKRAMKRIIFPSFSGEAFEVDIPLQVTAGE